MKRNLIQLTLFMKNTFYHFQQDFKTSFLKGLAELANLTVIGVSCSYGEPFKKLV